MNGGASKRCSGCRRYLDLSEFWRTRCSPDGYQHYCKHCLKARQTDSWMRKQARARAVEAVGGALTIALLIANVFAWSFVLGDPL